MFWHIVRFDFTGIDDNVRADIEERLHGLASLDEVAWLRVGHDVADGQVTALVTGFETQDDFEAYRVHPDHVPVVAAIEVAEVGRTAVDFETDDDAGDLP